VTSDAAPETALAISSGRRVSAEKHAAARLRDSVRALQAPPGSVRLYVLNVCSLLSFGIYFFRFLMSFFSRGPRDCLVTWERLRSGCDDDADTCTVLKTPLRFIVPVNCARCVDVFVAFRISDDFSPPRAGVKASDDVIEVPGSPAAQRVRRAGGLKMTPAQVATALKHHIYGDETGDERERFLSKVEEGARAYGFRGSTVSGTAGVDNLVKHLFSSFLE